MYPKSLKLLLAGLGFLLFTTSTFAQQSITISSSSIQDATIHNNTRTGYEYTRNANYGNNIRLTAVTWTNGGVSSYLRCLMRFDLSAIPAGSTIQSATLYLYSDPAATGSGNANGNSQLSGSNAFYLEKVTSLWSESTVTWNNQPTTTTAGRVWTGPSTLATENRQIDLTGLVQGWVTDSTSNHGLKMLLENEVYYRSRNYASTDHSNTSLHPKLEVEYTPPADPNVSLAWKDKIESIFEHVNPSYVTTGLLSDYGLNFTNMAKFPGILSDSNYVEYGEWRLLYASLFSSRFNTNISLTNPGVVFDRIDSTADANNGVILLTGLHYQYERFKDNALSSNLVYVQDSAIYDTPGRPSSPYQIDEAFALVPVRSVLRNGDYKFMFKPDFFYSNTGKTISTVQADFDNGTGFITLTPNVAASVAYSSTGEKTIVFRVTYTDASYKESHTKIDVKNTDTEQARYIGLNIEEFEFPRPDFQAPSPYLGKVAGALVTIEYTNPEKEIRRPLIIVEGFDPSDDFVFADIISTARGLNQPIDYTHNGNLYNTLSDALEGEQYDLIFIDFDDATTYIQRNAYLVENVIQWVNAHKEPYNGVMQENVVIGFSMGGLVARYALRDMELNSVTHDTRLYASIDTPHQGANVPLGFQAAISHLTGMGVGVGIPGLAYIEILNLGDLGLDEPYEMLNSPAARQMLKYQVKGEGNSLFHDNSDHTNFMNEYVGMGYPQVGGIRNIVIANGSECGTDQGYEPHAEFVNVDQKLASLPWWGDLLSAMFSSFYLFTNYPQLALGAVFTTDQEFRMRLAINALPARTSDRVYYGRMYVKKEILWLFKTNVTLFSKSFDSHPSYHPIDNAGGGINDFNRDLAAVPFPLDVNMTHFCFIPTFSALDIGGGTQTFVGNDLTNPYSPTTPPSAPRNVRADNFFTNPTEGGRSNELHTQITLRNGIWLLQEIEGQSAFFSCSYECAPYNTIVPFITGEAAICPGETYTVHNVPQDATVTWSHGNGLSYVSGQNTPDYSVALAGSTGQLWVEAGITGACGPSVPYRKDLVRGAEGIDYEDITITGPDEVCANEWYVYTALNQSSFPITQYTWIFESGWTILNQDDDPYLSEVTVRAPSVVSDGGGVDLAVTTFCGGYQPDWYKAIGAYDFCSSFAMYPNPADDFIEITETPSVPGQSLLSVQPTVGQSNRIKEIKLYNNFQQEELSMPFTSPVTRIDTKNLPTGYYILHIITDDGIKRKPFFIK